MSKRINIHSAIEQRNNSQVNSFLKNCSSKTVNTRDSSGRTPLHVAAADPDMLPVVKKLLKKKALINSTDTFGCTPLHIAAQSRCYDTCSFLIKSNANIHAISNNKNSVLSYMVKGDTPNAMQISIIQSILPKGLNEKNSCGETPFMLACSLSNDSIVELLLEHKAEVNIQR